MADEILVQRLVAEITADAKDAARALTNMEQRLDKLTRDRDADVNIEVKGEKKAEATLDKTARDRKSEIKVDVDRKTIDRAASSTKALKTELAGLQGIGAKFKGLQLSAAFSATAVMIPTVLSAIGPLTAAIDGLASAATAVVAPLGDMSKSLLAAPALISPVAAAAGSVAIAMKGGTEEAGKYASAWEELREASLNGTAEEIQEAKEAIADLTKEITKNGNTAVIDLGKNMVTFKDTLKDVQSSLGQELTGRFATTMKEAENALLRLQPAMAGVVQSAGRAIGAFNARLSSNGTFVALEPIMERAVLYTQKLGNSLDNLLQTFLNLSNIGGPFMDDLVSSMERSLVHLNAWTMAGAMTGDLAEDFDNASKFGRSLFESIENIGVALSNTFDTALPVAKKMYDSLEEMTYRWRVWSDTVTGQNAMKDWFERSEPVMEALSGLIRSVRDEWIDLAKAGEGPLVDIINLISNEFVPAIAAVGKAAANSGTIEALVSGASEFINLLATFKGTSGVLTSILELLGSSAEIANNMLMAFGPLPSVVADMATSFGLLKVIGIGSPIALGLAAIVTLTQQLTGDLEALAPVLTAVAAGFLAIKVGRLLAPLGEMFSLIRAGRSDMALLPILSRQSGEALYAAGGGARGFSAALGGINIGMIGVTAVVAAGIYAWNTWRKNIEETETRIDNLVSAIENGEDVIDAFNTEIDTLLDKQTEWFGRDYGELFDEIGVSIDTAREAAQTSRGDFQKLIEILDDLSGFGPETDGNWDDILDTYGLREDIENLDPEVQAIADAILEAGEASDLTGSEMESLADALGEIMGLTGATTTTLNDQASALAEAAWEAGVYGSVAEELTAILEEQDPEEKARLLGEFALSHDRLNIAAGNVVDTVDEQTAAMSYWRAEVTKAQTALDEYESNLTKIANIPGVMKTQRDLKRALIDTKDELKANGTSFDESTRAGLDNADAIYGLYQNYRDLAQGIVDNEGNIDKANGKWDEFKSTLTKWQQEGILPAKTSVDDLLASLGITDKVWEAEIKIGGLDKAKIQLELINTLLAGIGGDNDAAQKTYTMALEAAAEGKWDEVDRLAGQAKWISENPELAQAFDYDVTEYMRVVAEGAQQVPKGFELAPPGSMYTANGIRYVKSEQGAWTPMRGFFGNNPTTNTNTSALNFGKIFGNATGSLVDYFANGAENHVAQIAPAGAWRVWAEPETGGEAYIPLAPSKRDRSLKIWEETGKRLGAYSDAGAWEYADGGFWGLSRVIRAAVDTVTPKTNREVKEPYASTKGPVSGPVVPQYPSSSFGSTLQYPQIIYPTIQIAQTPSATEPTGSWAGKLGKAVGAIAGLSAETLRMVQAVKAAVPEMRVSSGYRNSKVAGTNRTSRHAYGKAADMVASVPGMERIYQFLKASWSPLNMYSAIWQNRISSSSGFDRRYGKNDHFDHVHGSTYAEGGINAAPETQTERLARETKIIRESQTISEQKTATEISELRDHIVGTDTRMSELREQVTNTSSVVDSLTGDDDHVMLGSGGIVTRATKAIVGENGPEAVIPLQRFADGGFAKVVETVNSFRKSKMAGDFALLEKVLTKTGEWAAFIKALSQAEPLKAVATVKKRAEDARSFFGGAAPKAGGAKGNAPTLADLAAQGMTSEKFMELVEQHNNKWNYLVSKAESKDTNEYDQRAIGAIRGKMADLKPWSNEWTAMLQRVEGLQARMIGRSERIKERVAAEAESKRQNQWEWTFDHASYEIQERMAREALKTMDVWSDEWVAMRRRIEQIEEQQRGGPAVIIQEAVFKDEADLAMLDRHIDFRVKAQR